MEKSRIIETYLILKNKNNINIISFCMPILTSLCSIILAVNIIRIDNIFFKSVFLFLFFIFLFLTHTLYMLYKSIYLDDIITISSLKIMNIQKCTSSNPYFLARNSHKLDLIIKSLLKQKTAY